MNASGVQPGTIGINGYMPSVGAPFGGIKASGIGREFAPENLASYQQQKSNYVMA
jgi:geranial dehydrogenase